MHKRGKVHYSIRLKKKVEMSYLLRGKQIKFSVQWNTIHQLNEPKTSQKCKDETEKQIVD